MTILLENISDFTTLITTCVSNNIKDIRVFISEKESYPNIFCDNTPKNHVNFTYVLFTPLYTAIYNGNVKKDIYNDIYENLENCQNSSCNHDFRIQVFENIKYDSKNDILQISKELNVI